MTSYEFTTPATETQHGTAYFSVDANSEAEARAKLEADGACEYYIDFSERDGSTDWEADAAAFDCNNPDPELPLTDEQEARAQAIHARNMTRRDLNSAVIL